MEPVTDARSIAHTLVAPAGDARSESLAETLMVGREPLRAGARESPVASTIEGGRIGRYVVLGRLGEGGMGVVVAAYDPELDRKVAIKVLQSNRSGRLGGHERLLREAQALARLSHPGVVAVHDVGTHDGRVFIAMEFIAGETLAARVASRPHSVAEIVGLYRQAGEGLAAAHRAGLVHRDFKPENVMVDAGGRARVVDFGLAQALAESESVEVTDPGVSTGALVPARLTATGALMGTPAYMAPEQHRGAATDARTDIFAFCVALYEDLYGERPFAGDSLVAIASNVLNGTIREAPRGARVSARLRRALLDGLSLEPDDRPRTMEALLHQLDRAVAAPARRRRLVALGGVALVGGLALGALALRDPAARCHGSAEMIAAVWSPEAKAAGAGAFTATGLVYADGAWSRAADAVDAWAAAWASARDEACVAARVRGEHSEALLDRRGACFERQLAYLRGLVDTLASADGKVVERVGDVVDSLPAARHCDASQVLDDAGGPSPPPADQLAAVDALGQRLAAAHARFRATYAEADLAALDALIADAEAIGYRPLIAETMAIAGEAHLTAGHTDVAEAKLVEALAHAEATGDIRRIAESWPAWMGVLTQGRSAFVEAEHAQRRGEALCERLGADHQICFDILRLGAILAHSQGQYARAIDLGRQAIVDGERLLGPDSLAVAEVLNNVGSYLLHVDVDEGVAKVERAVGIWERQLGPDHPKLAFAFYALARAAIERGDFDRADQLLREARSRFARMNPDHPNVGILTSALAQARLYNGDIEGALAEFRDALERVRRTQGERHANYAQTLLNIASVSQRLGRGEDARRAIDEAVALRGELFGVESVKYAEAQIVKAHILLEAGETAASRALADEAVARYERVGGGDPNTYGDALVVAGETALLQGDVRYAIECGERGLAVHRDDSTHDFERAGSRFLLARALRAAGRDPERVTTLAVAARASWDHWPLYYRGEIAEVDGFLADPEEATPLGAGKNSLKIKLKNRGE